MRTMLRRHPFALAAGLLTVPALVLSIPSTAQSSAPVAAPPALVPAQADRQDAFAAAAQKYGVPVEVLLGVSYLESRWDDHAGSPSTSGGYGPMHLTDVEGDLADGRGEGVPVPGPEAQSLHTLQLASELTGTPTRRLRRNDAVNIAGGAAVLARYQKRLDGPRGTASPAGAWYGAVAKYSGAGDEGTARRFADDVFAEIRAGQARTTNDGERMRLAPHRGVQPRRAQLAALDLTAAAEGNTECPPHLGCEWIPAPYEQYGNTVYDYGNHDYADRPARWDIDYIIIHDTEATYERTLQLVQDPTYVSWHYTLRSSDGHIAQNVRNHDVAFHAGNWYMNMHSIGLEHEGFAAEGASWYTEAMYRSSSDLVRFLSLRYDIPLDRGHIIGHDQIPGITPEFVAGMHWDPGPYWDWEHYFSLLGAPIGVPSGDGSLVTVAPGFDDNRQRVTSCERPGVPCDQQGTNFVYLRQGPSHSAPLVTDEGLKPDGSPSTTHVSDIGARAAAGHEFVVAERLGEWTKVWYLGRPAWFHDPDTDRTSVPSAGKLVTPKRGRERVPVYGRAYPEESAYPKAIPYQTVTPLQYTLKKGQSYVIADRNIETNYYYAQTYNDSIRRDHTEVEGKDRYYEIWFGHRMAYVRAAAVEVKRP